MSCELCKGTGWMRIAVHRPEGGAVPAMKRCVCRTSTAAAEEKARPGGFTPVGEALPGDWSKEKPMERKQPSDAEIERGGGIEYAAARAATLPRPDCEVAAIILNHRGKSNPVSIEEICKALWPTGWDGDEFGLESLARVQSRRNSLIRTVKASVERIRTQGRIPVAACKGDPGGYFIPETADEADEYAQRMFREGIKLFRTAQLFNPRRNWVEELGGQMRLAAVADELSSEEAER